MDKSPDAFRTISEVADTLETPAHVLRFWETRFPQIRPVKRAGGRRYYRPSDLALLAGIKRLLHDEGMTIRGVQKILREQGVRHVAGLTDEATAEEEALISAMTSESKPQEATVTRLTPREADEASVEALEAEAKAADPASGRLSEADEDHLAEELATDSAGSSATVIAFPADPTAAGPAPASAPASPPPSSVPSKETALPAVDADPRQIAFPGFEPASTQAGADEDDEEAPFIFELDPDDLPAELTTAGSEPASASISQFVAAQSPGPATGQQSGPQGAPDTAGAAAENSALPLHTLAARLRALPPGRLRSGDETLRSLSRRLRALRKRLDEAQTQPQ